MTDKTANRNVYNTVRLVPFTGPIFAVWAFFDPAGFGRWFGQIVAAFRAAAGL